MPLKERLAKHKSSAVIVLACTGIAVVMMAKWFIDYRHAAFLHHQELTQKANDKNAYDQESQVLDPQIAQVTKTLQTTANSWNQLPYKTTVQGTTLMKSNSLRTLQQEIANAESNSDWDTALELKKQLLERYTSDKKGS